MNRIIAALMVSLIALPAWAETLIIYQGGGLQRWQTQYSMRILDGEAQLNRYSAAVSPELVNEDDLIVAQRQLSDEEVTGLLKKIDDAGFFSLEQDKLPKRENDNLTQGSYALLMVQTDGERHEISVDNYAIPELNKSIEALQEIFPEHKLPIPQAACGNGEGVEKLGMTGVEVTPKQEQELEAPEEQKPAEKVPPQSL